MSPNLNQHISQLPPPAPLQNRILALLLIAYAVFCILFASIVFFRDIIRTCFMSSQDSNRLEEGSREHLLNRLSLVANEQRGIADGGNLAGGSDARPESTMGGIPVAGATESMAQSLLFPMTLATGMPVAFGSVTPRPVPNVDVPADLASTSQPSSPHLTEPQASSGYNFWTELNKFKPAPPPTPAPLTPERCVTGFPGVEPFDLGVSCAHVSNVQECVKEGSCSADQTCTGPECSFDLSFSESRCS